MPLARRQTIVGLRRVIAVYQSIDHQFPSNRFHRLPNARIVGRKKPNQWNHEQTRVEFFAAVGLNERRVFSLNPRAHASS